MLAVLRDGAAGHVDGLAAQQLDEALVAVRIPPILVGVLIRSRALSDAMSSPSARWMPGVKRNLSSKIP